MSKSDQQRSPAAHRIRLGSQWDFETLSNTDRSPDSRIEPPSGNSPGHPQRNSQRLKDVSDWTQAAGADYQGRVRLVRWFGRPSGLTPSDRVELVIDSLNTTSTVSLNDRKLEPMLVDHTESSSTTNSKVPVRLDVSAILRDRNQLAIELDLSPTPMASGILRDVWLEIFAED